MNSVLSLIARDRELFSEDLAAHRSELQDMVASSRFLVIGGAGSIGQAVTRELFKRSPRKLHVVDISENNLVELVRDLRSSIGYGAGEFQTLAIDAGSVEYDAFIAADGRYDYVLNLSALKHVRSERDPYTLMRMIDVNILNTEKTLLQSIQGGASKYFCVSTDKAANPVNMMGASKRIMELFLMRRSMEIPVSTARFANVAFSDGSLLHGFDQRIRKRQPIVAPSDVRRYFVTPQESGELCLMSCLLGENRDIFVPKLSHELNLVALSEVAVHYLKRLGYDAWPCSSEDEARAAVATLPEQGKWPCLFSVSDTTGEKEVEEFYSVGEVLDWMRFTSIGVIRNEPNFDASALDGFSRYVAERKRSLAWTKYELVALFQRMIPDFRHEEIGRNLDGKM